MAELPVLGLRIGSVVEERRETIDRKKLLDGSCLVEYKRRSVEDIWEMFDGTFGSGFPVEFIEKLGFDNLQWRQPYNRNAISAFFFGSPKKEPFELDKSQGVIEVISKVEDGKVKADELSISGVISDSRGIKRIIAVGYNLESKKAQRVSISVANHEIPKLDESRSMWHLPKYQANFRPIPNISNQLKSAIFISPGMVKQVSDRVLMVESSSVAEEMRFYQEVLVRSVGFFHSSEGVISEIGFKDVWSVEYPASLPETSGA